jgi:hypothetical protein
MTWDEAAELLAQELAAAGATIKGIITDEPQAALGDLPESDPDPMTRDRLTALLAQVGPALAALAEAKLVVEAEMADLARRRRAHRGYHHTPS